MATVLIVEDQTQILALARSLLEEEGYKTLTAPSAEDALVILAGSEPVDTLFVDIILNRDMQAGIDLAKRAIELKPGLKVVYSTGLTLTHEIKALLVPGAVILEKPFYAGSALMPGAGCLRLSGNRSCCRLYLLDAQVGMGISKSQLRDSGATIALL